MYLNNCVQLTQLSLFLLTLFYIVLVLFLILQKQNQVFIQSF